MICLTQPGSVLAAVLILFSDISPRGQKLLQLSFMHPVERELKTVSADPGSWGGKGGPPKAPRLRVGEAEGP